MRKMLAQNMRIVLLHKQPLMPVRENLKVMPVIIPTSREMIRLAPVLIRVMVKPSFAREVSNKG